MRERGERGERGREFEQEREGGVSEGGGSLSERPERGREFERERRGRREFE